MGIIDIDEDEWEELEENTNLDASINHQNRNTSRSESNHRYSRTPIRSTSTRYWRSIPASTPPTQSSGNGRDPQDSDLKRKLRDLKREVEEEKRKVELGERERRDLRASLYAPIVDEDRGRKRKSGAEDEDDDLDEHLLQYAIKKSKGDVVDVNGLDEYMLQYAIVHSEQGTLIR
jgi:hypothetical protein